MERRIKLLRHLTSTWLGEPIDADCLIRILNRDGTRPPLIWCYNADKEFPVMAAGLGPDQPVIGMRSLHMVEPMGPTRYRKDEIVADFYADALLSHGGIDLSGCFVGGNCQGAAIAVRIASDLLMANRNVGALVTMEAQSALPFPRRVGMIFGSKSEMFNPFLRGETPQAKWRTLFSDPVWEIIPGAHGQYFRNENYPALCAAIRRIIDLPANGGGADLASVEISLEIVDVPSSLKAGQRTFIRIRPVGRVFVDPAESGNIVIGNLWSSAEHGLSEGSGYQPIQIDPDPGEGGDGFPALVDTPAASGLWDLHVFVCRENGGPISWAANHVPKCSIRIV
jgi:hypothetical protein